MALKDDILDYLRSFPGATDTELEHSLGKNHQHINMTCRGLVEKGVLVRQCNPEKDNKIGNYPTGTELPAVTVVPRKDTAENVLQEEDIKHVLNDYLRREGWTVSVAWGHTPGVDIDARRGKEHWLIEVKGPGSRQPMRVNYFIGILGEMLQRMTDPDARYSIAFPDMSQYRGLWSRLPKLAKDRTTIDMLLIDEEGKITELH